MCIGVIGIAKEIFVPTSQMSNSTSGSASGSITPTATGSATSGNAVPLTNGGGSSLVSLIQSVKSTSILSLIVVANYLLL